MNVSIDKLNFEKGGGLIPAIVQACDTEEVLMLAYMNSVALQQTLESGYAHYWSRSRNKLWKKGETSGNLQKVENILVDCDLDAILLLVHQTGNACHKNKKSCFHNTIHIDTCSH